MNIWNFVAGVIGGTVGSSAIVLLIATTLKERWIERVRAGYAKELEGVKDLLLREQKALQARVDRSVFVSKAQFDAEFNAMRDIFRYATETSLAIDHLRPNTEISPANQNAEERTRALMERVASCIVAFNRFSLELSVLSPFYPESLFIELSQCREHAAIEIAEIQTGGDSTFSLAWYREGKENRKKFSAHYLAAGKIIRSRLDQLSVVPS
jgi:hypothetical protein